MNSVSLNKKLRDNSFAFLAVFCLSLSPVLVKGAITEGLHPVSLLTLRMVVGSITLWIVFSIFSPAALSIDRRGLIICFCIAIANATSMIFYYLALTRISASVAHVIFSIYPMFAFLLLTIRGERLTKTIWLRLGLALIGVYLLAKPGGHVDFIGAVLVISTSFLYGLHLNLIQWYLRDYSPLTIACYVVSFMAVILIFIYGFYFKRWVTLSVMGWGVILATGILSTAISRLAMFASIKHIGSGRTALIGPTETVIVVLWAFLFLGERLSYLQWIGACMILSGSFLFMAEKSTRVRNH